MPSTTDSRPFNSLVASLPRRDRVRFLQRCEPVDLILDRILCTADEPYRHIYFPLTGLISLLAAITHYPAMEAGLIGREGMLGVTLILGVNAAPLSAIVQGRGTALRMTARAFRHELGTCPPLLRTLSRYLYTLLAQLSQSAVCSRFHEVEPRLARWLLMNHDRADGDRFALTHQTLAESLGVQRSAVTIAAGLLQKRKLIGYSRGDIRILDRPGLEGAACECYGEMAGIAK